MYVSELTNYLYCTISLSLHNIAELGELEATKLQHESTIKDLTGQLNKLKDRVQWLETAKRSLEDKTVNQQEEQGNHMRSLERVSHMSNCLYRY